MAATANASSLASWNEGAAKSQILDFVARVTQQDGPEFVPPANRIAVFDNDGTLWCEQPMQVQVFFLISRIKELAEKDATVKERQPFKALLELDLKTLMGLGKQALLELVFATHSGMKEEEFEPIAREWLAKSKHPKFGRLFKHCTYQPQLELLDFLRAKRLQDLHRVRRWHRFHARMRRGDLWHSARAGDRLEQQAAVRNEWGPGRSH